MQVYCNTDNSNNVDKCRFYTKLSNIFLIMQLVGEVVDPVFSRQLKKASQDLLSGDLPTDLPLEVLDLLKEFAGNTEEVIDAFKDRLDRHFLGTSNIWRRMSNAGNPGESSLSQRDEFIVDFERADNHILDALNANDGDLINYWKLVNSPNLRLHRKNIEYLKCLERIMSSTDLYTEIFKGSFEKSIRPNSNPIVYTWNAKGIHHKDALMERNKGGIGRIVGSEKSLNYLGYFVTLVEMYNPEYPHSNNSNNQLGWKRKNKMMDLLLSFVMTGMIKRCNRR